MSDKKNMRLLAKEIQSVPLGYEGSIYNWSVQVFKNIYGIHPKDALLKGNKK